MIELSKDTIKEFKDIYLEEYGVCLDNGLAQKLAYNFIGLMDSIYKPFSKDE